MGSISSNITSINWWLYFVWWSLTIICHTITTGRWKEERLPWHTWDGSGSTMKRRFHLSSRSGLWPISYISPQKGTHQGRSRSDLCRQWIISSVDIYSNSDCHSIHGGYPGRVHLSNNSSDLIKIIGCLLVENSGSGKSIRGVLVPRLLCQSSSMKWHVPWGLNPLILWGNSGYVCSHRRQRETCQHEQQLLVSSKQPNWCNSWSRTIRPLLSLCWISC